MSGEVLTFNNRRAIHGRESFVSNGGLRHLKGVYVNIDEYKSAVRVLQNRYGVFTARHVGNQDYYAD